MARLGSVVGAILAELAQARVIADKMTRDLVAEYEDDALLSTLSVPRVTLERANLTLRFTVDDLEEPPPVGPDPVVTGDMWAKATERALLRMVGRNLPRAQAGTVVAQLAGRRVAVAAVEKAVSTRDAGALAEATSALTLEAWDGLPLEVRRNLGTKAVFAKALASGLRAEAAAFIERSESTVLVQQALASKLRVAVKSTDLPAEPQRVQEIVLTVAGADLDVLVSEPPEES